MLKDLIECTFQSKYLVIITTTKPKYINRTFRGIEDLEKLMKFQIRGDDGMIKPVLTYGYEPWMLSSILDRTIE